MAVGPVARPLPLISAELADRVEPWSVSVPLSSIPPPSMEELCVSVLPVTVIVPVWRLSMAPPNNAPLLCDKTELTTVIVPLLRMAPPMIPKLFDKVQSATMSVPELSIPPPPPALAKPCAIVSPAMLVVAPLETLKTMLALFPSIVRLPAPGPSISRLPVMSKAPWVSRIVPLTVGAKSIVVPLGAWRIA